MSLRPPRSPLFPYTTLFRSVLADCATRLRPEQMRIVAAHARHCVDRSEEHTSELQSRQYLVCRLLLEKKNLRNRPAFQHLTSTCHRHAAPTTYFGLYVAGGS